MVKKKITDTDRLQYMFSQDMITADSLKHGERIDAMLSRKVKEFVIEHHTAAISYMEKRQKYKTNVRDEKGVRKTIEARTEEDLYNKLFDFYVRLENSESAPAESPTLEEALQWLFKHNQEVEGVQKSTIAVDIGEWNRYISPSLAQEDVSKVTEEEICLSIRNGCKAFTERNKHKPRMEGVGIVLRLIRKIYEKILPEHGFDLKDPAKNIKTDFFKDVSDGSTKQAEEKCMEPRDVRVLTEYCKGRYVYSAYAVRLSTITGMRAGELCALKWSDIKGEWLHIHAQMILNKNLDGNIARHSYVDWTKNEHGLSNGGRYIPITNEMTAIFNEVHAKSLKKGWYDPEGFIFLSAKGVPLKTTTYMDYMRLCCKTLNLPLTNNHAIRMYVNSYILIPAGLTAPQRALYLGHSVRTNEKYYTWAGKQAREEAAEKLKRYYCTQLHSSKSAEIIDFEVAKAQ